MKYEMAFHFSTKLPSILALIYAKATITMAQHLYPESQQNPKGKIQYCRTRAILSSSSDIFVSAPA